MLVSMKVVICFHFTIFVVLETTPIPCSTTSWTLWFAFILLSLSYWKQPPVINPRTTLGCDLLSFYYLCRTGNNVRQILYISLQVVICFHFTIFVVLETTTRVTLCRTFSLWFAFILLSLSYWKQHAQAYIGANSCCDLLSFYYLCRTGNNCGRGSGRSCTVVICFHFTIFVVLETTQPRHGLHQVVLWFAFILLSLSYWKQPDRPTNQVWFCCDLLSFYYLCRTGNNGKTHLIVSEPLWFAFILLSLSYWKQPWTYRTWPVRRCDLLSFYYLCRTGNNTRLSEQVCRNVVICFHFTIFVVLETTNKGYHSPNKGLWFAFILLSLSYWKQPCSNPTWLHPVVICFHFTIFVVLETTPEIHQGVRYVLWFAFILLSLSYWKQQIAKKKSELERCDLLSFYYLCRTGNNSPALLLRAVGLWFAFILLSLSYWKQPPVQIAECERVVICFHFTIFVVLETTGASLPPPSNTLWFAFILLSLSYWKQLRFVCAVSAHSCDLLSFYYLCRTGNNRTTVRPACAPVVICFHFTIFVVLETTTETGDTSDALLWFAFILLSLSYWKQPLSMRWPNHIVVICFHFTIFVVLETTSLAGCRSGIVLWFAFILLSLSYWKQPMKRYKFTEVGCDLLSFYYLCRTGNNFRAR